MKKRILIAIICMLFLCINLVSCYNSEAVSDDTNDTDRSDLSDKSNESSDDLNIQDNQPSVPYPYAFESYEQLKAFFVGTKDAPVPALEEKDKHGDAYRNFVDNVISGKYKVARPYLSDKPMPIQDKEGYAKVDILPIDLYGRPWIWYQGVIQGQLCRVCISYLTDDEIEACQGKEASDVIKILYSGPAPNIDNISEFPNYEYIYENDTILKDRTVSALYKNVKDSTRLYVTFVYDDMLINIFAPENTLTEDFFSNFKMGY